MRLLSLSSTALLALALAGTAAAQGNTPPDSIVVTHQQIAVGGRPLKYTVRAGQLPLLVNDTGELMGRIFFVSYTVDRAPGDPPRPLTFVWNGGPGSSASQTEMVGVGPKHIKTADTYPEWGPNTETKIVDHPETWLVTSDLVFVDPPGTGFSRATSVANRDILYTSHGDAEAVAEFIRLYRTRFDAWKTPIFIGGESYGTTRAMLVAEALERRRDHLAGVLLISGFYQNGQTVPAALNQALQISLLTATGHYHKKLPADLQSMSRDAAVKEAVDWARRVYAPALARRDSLTADERTTIRQAVQRYSGIDPKYIDQRTLTVAKDQYLDHVLEDRGLELGRYDSRMSVKSRGDVPWTPTADPSLAPMIDLMQGTSVLFNSYVRDTLKYRSDLLYRGPFGEAFHPTPLAMMQRGIYDDWMAVMFKTERGIDGAGGGGRGRGGANGAAADSSGRGGRAAAPAAPEELPLHHAMTLDPKLLVMIMEGMYDGSCAASDEAVARTEPALRSRVSTHCYAGGHMMYSDLAARREMQRDFAAFVKAALSTR